MGSERFGKLSNHQLTRHIQQLAQDTSTVFITVHAKTQMAKRRINVKLAYECLQRGKINRTPEPNLRFGTLECRMERYEAGKHCCVVAALDDESPGLVCVTVFWMD